MKLKETIFSLTMMIFLLLIIIVPVASEVNRVHKEREAERIRKENQFMIIEDPQSEDEFLQEIFKKDKEFEKAFQESDKN